MIPDTWIPHRRGDGELVGYVRSEGDEFVPVDLFGHDLAKRGDWHAAESVLEDHGLDWLMGVWQIRHEDGSHDRVRIVEINKSHVIVKIDDHNDMTATPTPRFELPVPVPEGALTKALISPQEYTGMRDLI